MSVHLTIADELLERIRALGQIHVVAPNASREKVFQSAGAVEGMLIDSNFEVDLPLLKAAPRLRVISTASVGYDHIDIAQASRRGVLVCHTPGVANEAVTDLTMVLIYSLARRLFENAEFVRRGGWGLHEPAPGLGVDVRGKTLGVIGFGRIGQEVTRRMQAFGMRTLWYDSDPSPRKSGPKSKYMSLGRLLSESDFVSLHANLEPGTPPIIGSAELSRMKAGAFLINTGRGGLVDQEALTHALRQKRIAGAALDVLREEPPDVDEALIAFPGVICLPHIGTATHETQRAMLELAVENLLTALQGGRPPGQLI